MSKLGGPSNCVDLPIMSYSQEIIRCVQLNQVTLLLGDTGCGKTTMLGQILYDNNVPCKSPTIVTTNPRRIGAETVADRVCELRHCDMGGFVGYRVRFEDYSSDKTKLLYVTDGIILSELSSDPLLRKYNVIIIDEAHERSKNTDFLIAYLTRLIHQRKDLRVVITSATINTDQMEKYFVDNKTSVGKIVVQGRPYPVDIHYIGDGKPSGALNPVVNMIIEIHTTKPVGDVLAFLPGAEEIEKCCHLLAKKASEVTSDLDLIILPLYAALPHTAQKRVFLQTPQHARKIVIATNIAETSITVPGVKYVIDQGLVKVLRSTGGAEGLTLEPVSKAAAIQRTGRAGRTSEGICYRLYSEDEFNSLSPHSLPELLRVRLDDIILRIKSLGISLEDNFFLEMPPIHSIVESMKELYYIDAVDSEGRITDLGKKLVFIPLPPAASVALKNAVEEDVLDEVAPIIAMLNQDNLFTRSFIPLKRCHDDLIALFIMYKQALLHGEKWATSHGLNYQMLKSTQSVTEQITQVSYKLFKQDTSSTKRFHASFRGGNTDYTMNGEDEVNELLHVINPQKIIQSIYSGYWRNTAKKTSGDLFNVKNTQITAYIHPTSCCADAPDLEWVFFVNMTVSSSLFIRWVSHITKEMVEKYYGRYTKVDLQRLLGDQLYSRYKEELGTLPQIRTTAKMNFKRMEVNVPKVEEVNEAKKRFLERKRLNK